MFVRFVPVVLCVALARPLSLPAQPASGQRPVFERSDVDASLPQSSVYTILQDRRGFLWFGTREGLGRWDGHEMRTWKSRPFDPGALPGNLVRRIVEAANGDLWVWCQATDRTPFQVARLIGPDHERIESFPLPAPVPFLDREGGAWVADRDSLRRFDAESGRLVAVSARLTSEEPFSASVDRSGSTWVTTTTGGVERYAPGVGGTLVDPGRDAFPEATETFVATAVFEDDRGTVWVLGRSLRRLDSSGTRLERVRGLPAPLDTVSTNQMLQDPDGWLWIATHDGVVRMDPAMTTIERHSLRLPGEIQTQNWVQSLVRDRSGALWAGTPWGLHRADPAVDAFGFMGHNPADPRSLSSGIVMALHEDSSGGLWVGTLGGGLNRVSRATGQARRFRHQAADARSLPHDWVWGVATAPAGDAWVAHGSGLARFDTAGRATPVPLPAPDPSWHSSAIGLHADAQGGVWVGYDGRLWHRDSRGALRHYRLGVRTEIQQVLPSGDRLWLATTLGLVLLDPATGAVRSFTHEPANPKSLSNEVVLSLLRDRAGRLWVGTNSGLNRLEPDSSFTHFGEADGFRSSVIYAIVEDDEGLLWLSTNRGLVRFDPSAPAGTGVREFSGPAIGNVEFNRNAALKARDGTLFFGGDRGVTHFHPAALRDNPYRPPVVVTRVRRANREGTTELRYVDETTPVVVAPDDYTVTFELAALSFTHPSRNQYAYRLDGVQSAWVAAGSDRTASYTNLPPGRYVFRARAANEDGLWNETGIAVPVIVQPWFWETWWFTTLAFITVAAMISGATGYVLRSRHRLQIEQERRRHVLEAERARISRDMHDEVGASLTEIALLSERARRQAAPGEPGPLDRIAQRSRETLATIGEIVWAINPEHDRLDRLFAYLREYASGFLDSAGLEARLDLRCTDRSLAVTAELRRNVFLVLKEALANVASHAHATRVEVTLVDDGGLLHLRIHDDGTGFTVPDESRSTAAGHDGLANMRRRAAGLGSTLQVESVPGRGTTISLVVPLVAEGPP